MSLATNVEESFARISSRLAYFSDLHRAKRTVALCLIFVQKLKERLKHKSLLVVEEKSNTTKNPNTVIQLPSMTVASMQDAETRIIREVQADHFGDEIGILTSLSPPGDPKNKANLSQKKRSMKSCSSLGKLDRFLDASGIVRVGGRLKHATLSESVKFPIILPKGSHITNPLIKHCHEEVKHQGRGMTLSEIRFRGFWIIGGSTAVATHISKCVTCRKLRGKVQDQKMADLPVD